MDYMQNIGKNIRAVRLERKLSQQELADMCQFSNTTLSSYETGKKSPGLVTLATIAKKLGVSIERLYYGDENSAFINAESDVGKKIVNSLKLLWDEKVLFFDPSVQYPSRSNRSGDPAQFPVTFSGQQTAVVRLLKTLSDFSSQKDTYKDPEAYIDMILTSVAAEINKKREDAEELRRTPEPGKKFAENNKE